MSKVCLIMTDFGPSTLDFGLGWWSELESNQPFGFFKPALIRLSYPTKGIADWLEDCHLILKQLAKILL